MTIVNIVAMGLATIIRRSKEHKERRRKPKQQKAGRKKQVESDGRECKAESSSRSDPPDTCEWRSDHKPATDIEQQGPRSEARDADVSRASNSSQLVLVHGASWSHSCQKQCFRCLDLFAAHRLGLLAWSQLLYTPNLIPSRNVVLAEHA